MAFSNEPLSPPEADDFQRMGLRRMEFRPPVIRRAIIRSAQPLVLMHLRSPNAEVERLLVNVMLSGYRVLDPRRRDDSNQRVMLGRIHPQLVEEAVYLAQAKPTGAAAATLASAGVNAAGGVVAGGIAAAGVTISDDDDVRLSSGYSPIAERDWLESGEASLGASEGLLSGGFAPPSSTSDRFLDVAGSVAWDETLTGSDLMVQPTYQRIYRAIRRRLARASVVPLVSGAMLAASILLVLTWRTTVWIRSGGETPVSVEVAESILSPEEVARIAAAAAAQAEPGQTVNPEKTGTPTAPAIVSAQPLVTPDKNAIQPAPVEKPTVRPSAPDAIAAVGTETKSPSTIPGAAVEPLPGGNASESSQPGSSESKLAVPAEMPEMSSTSGVELAGAEMPLPAGSPKSEQPMLPVAVDGSAASTDSAAEAASELLAPTMTGPDAATKPAIGDVASASSAVSRAKAADDERMGLELLGLAEPAGSSGASMEIAQAVKRPPLPEQNLLGSARLRVESAARAIRVADGGSPLAGGSPAAGGSAAAASVAIFRTVAGESAEGSAERYVATLLAGQTAALGGLQREANRAIVDLTTMFDLERDAAMLRLARWMAADVTTADELRAAGSWIDGQVRASMLAGELPLAGELVSVIHEVGLKHRDDTLKADSKLWRDVLVISQRYADAAARVEAAGDLKEVSAEDRGLAGRYYAQVCRDWHRALPHFAACSTPKLTKLAGIELLGGQMIDGDDANLLADGYLAEAKRAKGWLGESFALRSHEALTLAAANSDRVLALELNRRASLVKVDYPRAFIPADDRVAASDESGKSGVKSAAGSGSAAQPAAAPTDGASLMPPPDRGPAQMLGRMRIGGEDAAVLIRYQAGMTVTRKLIDQMIVGLENAGGTPAVDAVTMPIELAFAGTLSVDRAKTVTFHLAGNGPGGIQALSINGRAFPIESASTQSPKRFEVDLMRGEYLIRWTTTLADGDQLSLRAVDESSGKLVPIFGPVAGIPDHPGAFPTRLRVDLIAAE